MLEWIQNIGSDAAMWGIVLSLVTFVGTLIALPLVLVWIPDDYFLKSRRERPRLIKRHPVIRIVLIIIRNLTGYVLILAGIVMLVLPGQGLLTIVVGLLLINFTGKDVAVRWLLSRGRIHHTVDWLRKKAGKKPMLVREPGHD